MERQENNVPTNVEIALVKRNETTRQKKAKFIRTYGARLCNVSATCEVVGIARQTFYSWMDKDDAFKKAIESCQEKFYDDLETTMFTKAIVDKDSTMLIWLSKTKMKQRGYVEKVEQEVTMNPFMELMQSASTEEP